MIGRTVRSAAHCARDVGRIALIAWCSWTLVATASSDNDTDRSAGEGYELSLSHRSAEQPVRAAVAPSAGAKFVQVEVTQVTNPERVPLSFEVAFRAEGGERIDLGTFSLFPPDNPGRFIVATQGRVRGRGTLTVTLVPLQRTSGGESIRVRVKPLALVAE